jgi:hypothetical protein
MQRHHLVFQFADVAGSSRCLSLVGGGGIISTGCIMVATNKAGYHQCSEDHGPFHKFFFRFIMVQNYDKNCHLLSAIALTKGTYDGFSMIVRFELNIS